MMKGPGRAADAAAGGGRLRGEARRGRLRGEGLRAGWLRMGARRRRQRRPFRWLFVCRCGVTPSESLNVPPGRVDGGGAGREGAIRALATGRLESLLLLLEKRPRVVNRGNCQTS